MHRSKGATGAQKTCFLVQRRGGCWLWRGGVGVVIWGWGESSKVGGGTCAGSPERRASGTGLSLEGGLVRARPPERRLAPPQSIRPQPSQPGDLPEPPSSAAARVAEARESRVEPERPREL